MNKKIKLFLTDVDGTLTDGGMYYTAAGDAMKKFNTRDGMGLQLIQREGVKAGIVTSELTLSRRVYASGCPDSRPRPTASPVACPPKAT